jgi:hypothetical protein
MISRFEDAALASGELPGALSGRFRSLSRRGTRASNTRFPVSPDSSGTLSARRRVAQGWRPHGEVPDRLIPTRPAIRESPASTGPERLTDPQLARSDVLEERTQESFVLASPSVLGKESFRLPIGL